MLATMPATGEGMGATAFSFSISTMVWPLAMRSPALTKMLTTVPDSAPSPSLGSLTSIIMFNLKYCSLPARGKHFFRVHFQFLERPFDRRRADRALLRERVESGHHDHRRIDFEEAPEVFAGVAPAEAVRPQRCQSARHPGRDLVRDYFHAVGDGHEDAWFLLQRGLQVRPPRRRRGMKPVPAIGLARFGAEALVVRHAPNVGGDVEFLRKNFLGLERSAQQRAAAENLRPKFLFCRAGFELVKPF